MRIVGNTHVLHCLRSDNFFFYPADIKSLPVLVSFSVIVIKKQLKGIKDKEIYYGPQFEGTVHHDGKSQQRKLKAAGQMGSPIRKQRMTNACLQFTFLDTVQEPVGEQCYLQWAGLPTSITVTRIIFPQACLKAHLPDGSRFCQCNNTNHHHYWPHHCQLQHCHLYIILTRDHTST